MGSKWDDHCKWLHANFAREDVVLLIGLEDGEPCGLVWFKKNRADVWETSLNLAAEFRGKRLSEPMLAAALAWMREHRGATMFSTEIKDGNEGAIKAYERCGYRYVHPSPGFGTYFVRT